MLTKLLIANRGEIAIRIARTATDMGIGTVAIYSPDDANSLHLKHTTLACELPKSGPAGYLDGPAIIDIALQTGCDSIHPGYGFLSERADFARQCHAAGLVFVGPDAQTLLTQGNKITARSFARDLDVPVIEGQSVSQVSDIHSFFSAHNMTPIMVKAVNGGGGRGMRIVKTVGDIDTAFTQCQAESLAAFGDDSLYVERFLSQVRHIEVQIIGDGSHVRHLWDRDCSLQRRNQKIVEMAPAPALNAGLRQAMLDAAVRIGQASQYKGLGTVEFLLTSGPHPEFFFIETNPRLQVEHTVTEEITGLDLVEMQLRIAAGERLSTLDIDAITPNGYAVQTRINCENLNTDGTVTPTGGVVNGFAVPGGRGVRVDSTGYQGYRTNPAFDSLLAKLIVHTGTNDPAVALAKAERALSEFNISGVETNIGLLRNLLSLPQVQRWDVTVATVGEALKTGALSTPPNAPRRYFETVTIAQSAPAAQAVDYPENTLAITSPMQAVVVLNEVAVGDVVRRGDVLIIVEAMKMQHEIKALGAGTVQELLVQVGDVVDPGQGLILIERGADDGLAQIQQVEIDPDFIRPDLQSLRDRAALTLDAQRPKAVARRRSRGQRTVRENVADLVGGGAFSEYGQLVYAAQRRRRTREDLMANSPADGIITGIGAINADLFADADSRVAILAYDGTVMAGTQGMLGHKKTDRLLHLAIKQKLPVVFYTEGGGGRPGDEDYGDTTVTGLDIMTFNLVARLNADKPSIAVNSGYCFAGNAAVFGACDIKIATRASWIGLGGPAMVEAGGLGTFGPKDIGPAPMQAKIGLVDLLAKDEADATRLTKQVLGYFQGDIADWNAPDQRLLRHVIPENRKRVYDIHRVIDGLVDCGSFLELRPDFAIGMITGFMRINGRPFGLIANNPMHLGGAIDAPASQKAAAFLRLCGRFELPVVSLCDTPGFMVGPASEEAGGVQRACEFIGAGALLSSPLFTVVLRKGYGIGAQAMAGGSFAAPFFLISWPTGEFGAMGLEGSVELGYKHELDAKPDPVARQALFDRLVAQAYEKGQALNVAALLEIDAVIDPAETRDWILNGLRAAQG